MNYCAKLRCKEFAAQRRNREAKIKHGTATITAQKQCCKDFAEQRRNREAKIQTGQPQLSHKTMLQRICGAVAKPKIKQGSATIPTLTIVRNPCKIRAAAQYV